MVRIIVVVLACVVSWAVPVESGSFVGAAGGVDPSVGGDTHTTDPTLDFLVLLHPLRDRFNFASGDVCVDVGHHCLVGFPPWSHGGVGARAPQYRAEQSWVFIPPAALPSSRWPVQGRVRDELGSIVARPRRVAYRSVRLQAHVEILRLLL